MDLFPTFMELAGGKAPANYILDGKSLLPLMCGQGSFERDAIYMHHPQTIEFGILDWPIFNGIIATPITSQSGKLSFIIKNIFTAAIVFNDVHVSFRIELDSKGIIHVGFTHYFKTPSGVMRQGDFKLVYFYGDHLVDEHNWEGGIVPETKIELYNIKEDISESKDLAKIMPEKAKNMKAKMDAWLKKNRCGYAHSKRTF